MGALSGPLTDQRLESDSVDDRSLAGAASEPAAGSVIWVDSTRAVVLRWVGHAVVDHVEDDVPSRHRSTGTS